VLPTPDAEKKAPSEEGAIRGRTVESLCAGVGSAGVHGSHYLARAGALRAGRLAFLRGFAAGLAAALPVTLA